jgi:hypothetical protein
VDVFITPEAQRELEALRVFRPKPRAWGVLLGHKRGFRFIIEKALLAGDGRTAPGVELLAGLDGIWPGRTVGLFAFRPDAAFKKAVLGPAWYGKLLVQLTGAAEAPIVRSSVVEFERKFFLAPAPLSPPGKEKAYE